MKLAIVTAFPPSKVTLTEYGYYLAINFGSHPEVEEIILLTDRVAGNRETILEGIPIHCRVTIVPCCGFNRYRNPLHVLKAVSKHRPDGVLFNLQFLKFGDKKIPAALGLSMPALCRLKGIPTIVLLHNILEQVNLENAGFTSKKWLQYFYNFTGTVMTRLILRADLVAVTIKQYVTILQDKYKTNKVVQIPHGAFELPPEPPFSLPEGPRKIMTFGKFGTYKKVEVLIEAVEMLRSRTDIPMEIVIAGTDNPNTPGYLASVKEKYAHVPHLTFTGYVEEDMVANLFYESAVVVLPYTSTTGSSGVLHQAGSYGKAIVLPDISDLGVVMREEGYDGEFFEPEDATSLATAIEAIVGNDERRIELGKTNYKAACSLPMTTITRMYLDHFKALIAKKNS